MQEFGEKIRAARQDSKLSLREVARRIGVSPATISAIENGKTGVSVKRLQALAAALGVVPATLLPGAETRRPPGLSNDGRPGDHSPDGATSWRDFPPLELDPVLSAAVESFVETGYHGATMRSLAQRAGVSVPVVYHHYRDKQDILMRALEITMTELRWRVCAARDSGESSIARVSLIVEALALYHTHRQDLGFLGASEMRSLNTANRRRITMLRNEIQYMLDDDIAGAAREGHVATVHGRAAGRAIATMCTALPQWFRADGELTPEQVACQYASLALGMLGAGAATVGDQTSVG
ncbi:MAG: TetR family transcriptional regulator [Mycobacterium sp.]